MSRAVVQQTYGCARAENNAKAVVFGTEDFTKQAVAWADKQGVALYRFDFAGTPEPVPPGGPRLGQRALTSQSKRPIHVGQRVGVRRTGATMQAGAPADSYPSRFAAVASAARFESAESDRKLVARPGDRRVWWI